MSSVRKKWVTTILQQFDEIWTQTTNRQWEFKKSTNFFQYTWSMRIEDYKTLYLGLQKQAKCVFCTTTIGCSTLQLLRLFTTLHGIFGVPTPLNNSTRWSTCSNNAESKSVSYFCTLFPTFHASPESSSSYTELLMFTFISSLKGWKAPPVTDLTWISSLPSSDTSV